MGDLFDDMHKANTGRLRADQYTFIEHTIAYPPPGEGWFLVTVVARVSGSSSSSGRDGIDRGQITSMGMSSTVVGVWGRRRTDEDKERERRNYWAHDWDRLDYQREREAPRYAEWLRDNPWKKDK